MSAPKVRSMKLRLDYETYSELDLTKVGAHKYAQHPSTEVLMAAYWIDGERYFWDATAGSMPVMLAQALQNPDCLIHAFNAQFERLITKYVLRIDVPARRFRCTMVRAYSFSFKGDLFDVGEQLDLPPELMKSKTGRSLINRFCKPAPENHKATRYARENSPELWAQFCEYCRQDVVTEDAIDQQLDRWAPWSDAEQAVYELDQKINDRGVPVDTQMIAAAQSIARQVRGQILERMKALTGLSNPNSQKQLVGWLLRQDVLVPKKYSNTTGKVAYTLDADHLKILEEDWRGHPVIGEVLRLKQQLGKTSVTKYKAFERAELNGRVYGMFQMNGAQRTGRWAGRVVQLHNLATPRIADIATAAGYVKFANADLLAMMYGDPLLTLSYCIRPTITAPEEKTLNVSDLGSIESRMLGWHAACERINRTFAEGKDTYEDFATELFGVPYEAVTPEQRKYSKPPTLGCGYRLGGAGLVAYAEGMGVKMTKKEGFHAVRVYRKMMPEVVNMWYWLENAIMDAIRFGTCHEGYGVRIWCWPDMLCIQLPSGRILYYHKPTIERVTVTFETEEGGTKTVTKEGVTFMGTDKFHPNLWSRVSAHGGVFTENIIQACARDVLAVWMQRADVAGYTIIGHVHDEIIAEEDHDRLGELNTLIRQFISWAPGLLLDAAGYVAQRYRKD